MSRYRKIDMRMYADEKYRKLSRCPACGQALWWHLIAGRQTGMIPGLFSVSEIAFADQLKWPLEGFRKAFREVSQEGMAEADWDAELVWVKNAIRYNPPQSPNVIVSWRSAWLELPECSLKAKAWQALLESVEPLGKAFVEAFRKALGKPSPKAMANQEQEQEQEQEQDLKTVCSDPPEAGRSLPTSVVALETPVLVFPVVAKKGAPAEWPLVPSKVAEFRQTFPDLDIDAEVRMAHGWVMNNSGNRKTYAGMPKFLFGWLSRSQNRGAGRSTAAPSGGGHKTWGEKQDDYRKTMFGDAFSDA